MSKTQVERTAEILGGLVLKLKQYPAAVEELAVGWASTVVAIGSWIPRLRRGSKFGPNDTIGVREVPPLLDGFVVRHMGDDAISGLIAEACTQIRDMVGDPAH